MLKKVSYLPAEGAAFVFIPEFQNEKSFLPVEITFVTIILHAEKGSYLPAKVAAVVFLLQFQKDKSFLPLEIAAVVFILHAEKGILFANKNSCCRLHL